MSDQRLEYLFECYISQAETPDEREELMDFIASETNAEKINQMLDAARLRLSGTAQLTAEQSDRLFRVIEQATREANAIPMKPSRILPLWQWAAAAAILILFGTGTYFWFNNNKTDQILANSNKLLQNDAAPGRDRAILTLSNGEQIILDSTQGNIIQQGNLKVFNLKGKLDYEGKVDDVAYHTLSTPKGGQYKIRLADGTDVWLNAASSITYPTAFIGKQRTVTITGEAYFEVAKDKSKPFHVKVNDMEVVVLGTHFNINSYSDEGSIRTTLLEGSVKVKEKQSVVLKPGQQAEVEKQQMRVINNADIDQVMAWKNGLFQFKNADIKTVMRQIARWYDLEVSYEGKMPDDRFEGKLPRNAMASQVLSVLEKNQVHFRIEGKQLIVMP